MDELARIVGYVILVYGSVLVMVFTTYFVFLGLARTFGENLLTTVPLVLALCALKFITLPIAILARFVPQMS